MKITSYSKDFFQNLIEGLKKTNIKYAIIGDYKNLPESVGHDIDIWTDEVPAFRKVLFESIMATGHRVLIDNKTANGCNVAFYRRDGETITLMKIDVLIDTSWIIVPLVDKNSMSANVTTYNGFSIANKESEAVMHFLYPMFQWGKIKKDVYKADILDCYMAPVFQDTFTKLWGLRTAKNVLDKIAEEKWEEIEQMMPSLRKKALFKAFFRSGTYSKIWNNLRCVLSRKLHPSGYCLAFCGLDGAGKTTIIDELNEMFTNLLKSKKVFYGYWRPFAIPEIRELFGRENSKAHVDREAQKGVTIAEPDKKASGKLASFIKFIYYWLDYMLANRKYGSIRERGGMVFFDRHYIDTIVFPLRFGLDIPRWIMQLLYHFIPKADYTFFLYCTPEEIRKRKEEFTIDEIKQQTANYMTAGEKIKNFVPIETNKTISIEIDEILSHIALK